jgi:hypothetical protein
MLKKPSVRPGKGKEKSDAPDSSETHSSIKDEEDDIAEAVARSLGEHVGDPELRPCFHPYWESGTTPILPKPRSCRCFQMRNQ